MEPDEDVCLCFHVTRRKLEQYLLVTQPSRASQLSECGGAGTGCGWCVRILENMFAHYQSGNPEELEFPTSAEHAEDRQDYLSKKPS